MIFLGDEKLLVTRHFTILPIFVSLESSCLLVLRRLQKWQTASNLIQTVRGLDQTGPGPNGENLDVLWQNLTVASDGKFHAAEESALRWLLKSMNGTSQSAETMRRYPLTWNILNRVFRRIPLFSLAKSLADRRFVSVLEQTLKDISSTQPARQAPESTSAKRKRSPELPFALDELRGTAGCLATGQAVFTLLRSLLSRLGDETIDSRSRIGAEHIKSLFSTSAAEAAALFAAALAVCKLLLNDDGSDLPEGRNKWIRTMSAIWDLHLQGADDALEVATHLFTPAVPMLAKLQSLPGSGQHHADEALVARWSSDLSKFMHTNLILPARTAFLHHQDLEAVTRALDVAVNNARLAAPVLYALAAGAPDPENERDVRRGNATWMRQVFQTVESRLRKLDDRNRPLQHILKLASARSILVDVEDLRVVCRDYGMGDGQIDWDLLAKAAICNPNIFPVTQDDNDLLTEVCQKSVTETDEGRYQAISDVVVAIQKSFCTRRSFSSFLKLWYKQMCSVERLHYRSHPTTGKSKSHNISQAQGLISKTPWFALSKHAESPSTWMESETSPSTLLEVIEWLRDQEPSSTPHAFCIFADSVGRGLRTEAFIDGVGTKLLDLTFTLDAARPTALRWRVVSKTFSWVSRDQKKTIWSQVKDELSKVFAGPVMSADFFEAFKGCIQIWGFMDQDETVYAREVDAVIRMSADKISQEMVAAEYLGPIAPSLDLDRDASSDYDEHEALNQYLAWCILGTSRALKLYWTTFTKFAATSEDKTTSLHPLDRVFSGNGNDDTMRILWDTLLRNDVNLNDTELSQHLVKLLAGQWSKSRDERPWPGEQGSTFIQLLSKVPSEAMVDDHRRFIVKFLEDQRPKMKRHSKAVTFEHWKAVLDLSTKLASKPIAMQQVEFDSLVDIADALSNVKYDHRSTSGDVLLEMIERFFVLVSTTLKERATYPDRTGPHYFITSGKFVSDCDNENDEQSIGIVAFRITLLKALASELRLSRRLQTTEELADLLPRVAKVLAKQIAAVMGESIDKSEQLLSTKDRSAQLCLLAAIDAATVLDDEEIGAALAARKLKATSVRELDVRSKKAMTAGDFVGWKLQVFIQKYLAVELEGVRPTKFVQLPELSTRSRREELLKEYVDAVIRKMGMAERTQYLAELIHEFGEDCDTDGQILAVEHVVNQLIEKTDLRGKAEGADLAAAHSQLISSITRSSPNSARTCRVLQSLLEKKPQAMGQWNIEITLSTIAKLASEKNPPIPFPWLCRLAAVIIKKHRLRLEGHYHILLTIMQALLRTLVTSTAEDETADRQESWAHMYGRLVSLICEPTVGSVSRSQHQSALDSATDVAKRSAGRHMYLVLMQYVKLQLETKVGRPVLEALEPAMNTIFDITPPEVRKILNDAMDASGRAVLREMYKRYVKFGKWSGI